MKRSLVFLLIPLAAFVVFFTGCKKKSEAEQTSITVKGSDTMVNLSQRWAEVYMNLNPEVSIQITGGGSGTGVASLLNGTTNLANSSRELKDNELEEAAERGITPKVYEVALDGIAVIVHPGNPVTSLTVEQLSDIFSGEITNWKDVGGNDAAITLYGRENSSGTYEFFREEVLGKDERGVQKDFAVNTQVLQGTAALGESVARDMRGIGYGGVGYFAARNDVKIIGVQENKDAESVYPAQDGVVNYEDIWSGKYSISRYLYCFTDGKPNPEVEKFLDFIVSEEGQELVKEMEYIPLPENK
jgi:phosphate transport system substrate-binding protein